MRLRRTGRGRLRSASLSWGPCRAVSRCFRSSTVVALRTGDISKQLTVIATIFLPLTFLTGFFGMNFDVLSKREYLYFVLGCAVTLPITLVAVFRRKGWF